jgi:hypothetical protein
MFTAPLLAVLRSRRRRLAGQLDAAEHALAAAPANDRLPRWMRERVLAKCIRRGLARRDPDARYSCSTTCATVHRAPRCCVPPPPPSTWPPAPCSAGDRRSRRAPSRRAEAQLVRADLLAADGHTAEAVTVLDEALRAAEPDGLRRPFRDADGATTAAHSPRPRRPPSEAVRSPTSADFMQPARRPDGATLMCDPAGQLPGHPALKPQSDPPAWTVTVAWCI